MKFGILGYGSIGQRHAANLLKLGHDVYIYEPDDPQTVFQARQIVLDCSDAIVVCSPSKCHAADLTDALNAGKHVFVEKPFGYDCPEYLRGVLCGRSKINPNLVIVTGFNLRFHEAVMYAKAQINHGALGDIKAAGFTVCQKTIKPPYLMDGIIRNWCSHELDLAMYLLGDLEVKACIAPRDKDGRDTDEAIIMLESPKGFKVSIHADYYTDPEVRCFWIAGELATIYVDLVKRTVRLDGNEGLFPPHFHQCTDTFDQNYVDEINEFAGLCQAASDKECVGVIHHHLATGEDGVRNLYAIMEARRLAGFAD